VRSEKQKQRKLRESDDARRGDRASAPDGLEHLEKQPESASAPSPVSARPVRKSAATTRGRRGNGKVYVTARTRSSRPSHRTQRGEERKREREEGEGEGSVYRPRMSSNALLRAAGGGGVGAEGEEGEVERREGGR